MSIINSSESFATYFKTILKNDLLESEMQKAMQSFYKVSLKKNDFFVEENKVCDHFCFVESGILQHAIVIQEEEKTTYLALKNSVTSSLNSFLNKTPSRKSIKAITDATLYIVTLEVFNDLIRNNTAFHQFYYNLIEKQICLIDDYRIDLLTLTPEERYKKL